MPSRVVHHSSPMNYKHFEEGREISSVQELSSFSIALVQSVLFKCIGRIIVKMVFNYWSVYVLLAFLLKRNPSLNQRWPRFKIDMVRFMTREGVLWKLRGVLCAATRDDILEAYRDDLFWTLDLLDTLVRILRMRRWHEDPVFAGAFTKRSKFSSRNCYHHYYCKIFH